MFLDRLPQPELSEQDLADNGYNFIPLYEVYSISDTHVFLAYEEDYRKFVFLFCNGVTDKATKGFDRKKAARYVRRLWRKSICLEPRKVRLLGIDGRALYMRLFDWWLDERSVYVKDEFDTLTTILVILAGCALFVFALHLPISTLVFVLILGLILWI